MAAPPAMTCGWGGLYFVECHARLKQGHPTLGVMLILSKARQAHRVERGDLWEHGLQNGVRPWRMGRNLGGLRHCVANGRLTLSDCCALPGACHGLSCVFGIYIQAFVVEAQVLPGSFPGRAHWHLSPSPARPYHTPARDVPESPVGTRVRPYRTLGERPVALHPRSYRRQNHPFAGSVPGKCPVWCKWHGLVRCRCGTSCWKQVCCTLVL